MIVNKFPFPSNGKAYPKKEWCTQVQGAPKSFHSLQTGKRIQRQVYNFLIFYLLKFPFPSNGKAYPKNAELKQIVYKPAV